MDPAASVVSSAFRRVRKGLHSENEWRSERVPLETSRPRTLPGAIGTEQKSALRESFELAAQDLPVGEPLDWMERPVPTKWKLNGRLAGFEWDENLDRRKKIQGSVADQDGEASRQSRAQYSWSASVSTHLVRYSMSSTPDWTS